MNATVNKQYSFPHRVVWLANLFFICCLALSYLSKYISPADAWWLTFFGLGYGTLLIINLLFVLVWIWRKSRKFLASLMVCMAGINYFFSIYEPAFFRAKAPDPSRYVQPLKVMTFNVRLFDLYNWFHNKETRDKIYRFLQQESPDIVCFQEYFSSDDPNSDFRCNDTLPRILAAPYSQLRYTVNLNGTEHFGTATYSKFPILREGSVRFKSRTGNVFLFTDILVGEDTIRVFNTHLESIRFRREDYRFIENLGNDEIDQEELEGGLNILRKLKRAFVKRGAQVEIIQEYIRRSPYPVILCGDFNDTPVSYTMGTLTNELKDAFRISGEGWGKTYTGVFPSFRIDYILHDKTMKSFGYVTHRQALSDHYPVSCYVTWKKRGL